MRDDFRLPILTSILLLAWAAPGNMALAQTPSPASWEESLSLQYRTGTMLYVRTPGVVGTIGCNVHPTSNFKDGTLHAPGFAQNLLLSTAKCEMQPIAPATQVYLSVMQVTQKSNRVDFVVLQCNVPDCSGGVEGAIVSQVEFEFPKGFLATAQLAQVEEAIHHVFAVAGRSNATAQQGGSQPVSPTLPPAVTPGSQYLNSQNPADRLQLNTDDSFSLQEAGQSFTGKYSVAGATLKLHIVELQKDVDILVQGNDLVVNGEEIWTQPGKVSSESPATAPYSQLAGHYVDRKDARNFFNLKADGSMYLMQKGKSYGGSFSSSGDEITLVIGGVASKGRIAGDTITDSNKGVWVKESTQE